MGQVGHGRICPTEPSPGHDQCSEPPIGKKKARQKAQKHGDLLENDPKLCFASMACQHLSYNIRYSLAG